jgi:hypothetical protein
MNSHDSAEMIRHLLDQVWDADAGGMVKPNEDPVA